MAWKLLPPPVLTYPLRWENYINLCGWILGFGFCNLSQGVLTRLRLGIDVVSVNARLEAMSARAATAETLLAEARQSLLARAAEANRAVAELANETAARHAAEKKLDPVQEAVRAQERRVHELEQARSKLIEDAGALVRSLEARDGAVARADETIRLTDTAQDFEAAASPRPSSRRQFRNRVLDYARRTRR